MQRGARGSCGRGKVKSGCILNQLGESDSKSNLLILGPLPVRGAKGSTASHWNWIKSGLKSELANKAVSSLGSEAGRYTWWEVLLCHLTNRVQGVKPPRTSVSTSMKWGNRACPVYLTGCFQSKMG